MTRRRSNSLPVTPADDAAKNPRLPVVRQEEIDEALLLNEMASLHLGDRFSPLPPATMEVSIENPEALAAPVFINEPIQYVPASEIQRVITDLFTNIATSYPHLGASIVGLKHHFLQQMRDGIPSDAYMTQHDIHQLCQDLVSFREASKPQMQSQQEGEHPAIEILKVLRQYIRPAPINASETEAEIQGPVHNNATRYVPLKKLRTITMNLLSKVIYTPRALSQAAELLTSYADSIASESRLSEGLYLPLEDACLHLKFLHHIAEVYITPEGQSDRVAAADLDKYRNVVLYNIIQAARSQQEKEHFQCSIQADITVPTSPLAAANALPMPAHHDNRQMEVDSPVPAATPMNNITAAGTPKAPRNNGTRRAADENMSARCRLSYGAANTLSDTGPSWRDIVLRERQENSSRKHLSSPIEDLSPTKRVAYGMAL